MHTGQYRKEIYPGSAGQNPPLGKRSIDRWQENNKTSTQGTHQALFGIIQGSTDREMREEATKLITSMPFDGVALGGETIGYNMESTLEIIDWLKHLLPKDKPVYTMGLGRDPDNIVEIIKAGVDMFDCVAPTRLARNGALYHGEIRGNNFESEFPKGPGNDRKCQVYRGQITYYGGL